MITRNQLVLAVAVFTLGLTLLGVQAAQVLLWVL